MSGSDGWDVMIRRKLRMILQGIMAIGICLVLVYLWGRIFKHISEEMAGAEQAVTGNGWETAGISDGEDSEELYLLLEQYLSEAAASGVLHLEQVTDERFWNALEKVQTAQEREAEDGLLREKLIYAAELAEQRAALPDYRNYLADTDGVINEVLLYAASGERDDAREAVIVDQLRQAVSAMERQKTAGMVYSAGQLERAAAQCRQLLEEGELEESGADLTEAVENMLLYLSEQEGTDEWTGLCGLPSGSEYYDYLLERETGTGMTAGEMYDYLTGLRAELELQLQQLEEKPIGEELQTLTAQQILEQLQQHTRQELIDTIGREYRICGMPELLQNRNYIGFYRYEPGADGDVICIDETYAARNAYEKYEMLAHEGYPGHMYCYSFQDSGRYEMLDYYLMSPGFSEGWAVYSEFLAAGWLDEDEEGYLAFITRKLRDEVILSQMDIGIHAFGWEETQLADYCREAYGQIEEEGIAEIGRALAEDPAMYQAYTVGYGKICQLREIYLESGKSEADFVRWLLQDCRAPLKLAEQHPGE